ncbi:MAG: hypothetical protein ABH862_04275 [Candidatus Omnitrophota bacterium]
MSRANDEVISIKIGVLKNVLAFFGIISDNICTVFDHVYQEGQWRSFFFCTNVQARKNAFFSKG